MTYLAQDDNYDVGTAATANNLPSGRAARGRHLGRGSSRSSLAAIHVPRRPIARMLRITIHLRIVNFTKTEFIISDV